MRYPTDNATARASRRAELEANGATRGRHDAIRSYSSINCEDGKHAPDGCQNTGSTCLCSCHDPKEPTP